LIIIPWLVGLNEKERGREVEIQYPAGKYVRLLRNIDGRGNIHQTFHVGSFNCGLRDRGLWEEGLEIDSHAVI
jgi:hypothetical protein